MNARQKITVFYTLLISQTFSLIGSRMTGLALSIAIFNDTGEATPLVLVSFFAFLPRLLSASLAGLLADRWNRRYVMMIADAGQAVGTVLLLISLASGNFQLWHLYVVTVIQSIFDIFQTPAFQSTVTTLITDQERSRANALQLITSPIAGIIAPAVTGSVYALIGLNGIIVFDLVTFGVSALVLALIPLPEHPPAPATGEKSSFWREVNAGFSFVWNHKPLLMIFVFTGGINFFYAGALSLQIPYVLSRTGSEATLGVLLGIFSAGTLAGSALMTVWRGTRRRVRLMMPVMGTAGLLLMVFGTAQPTAIMGLLMFLMAMGSPINNVAIISTLQLKVPLSLQGRVFAAISQISMTLIPLSYIVTGPLVDRVFEPFALTPGWATFAPIYGSGPGAGMGLLLTIAGASVALISFGIFSLPIVRNLESLLPDQTGEPVTASAVS